MNEKAYEMYLRTARLDLDNYNNDTCDGLHITSMGGTWMAFVLGLGGMRVSNNQLSFNPILPKGWKSYSFMVNFRGSHLKINVSDNSIEISNLSNQKIQLFVSGKKIALETHSIQKIWWRNSYTSLWFCCLVFQQPLQMWTESIRQTGGQASKTTSYN